MTKILLTSGKGSAGSASVGILMGLKVIPVTHLSRTHVAVGGRKQGRPSSIEPKEKEGCPGHEWKTYKGPHPALDFKYCKVCHEVIWLPPDRMW